LNVKTQDNKELLQRFENAEEYRYHFLIDCDGYRKSVEIADELLAELLKFEEIQ